MENYIAKLNEYVQKTRGKFEFEDVGCDGPDHMKTFSIRVVLNDQACPVGVGNNKKEARQKAAELALRALKGRPDSGTTENTTPAPSTPSQSPFRPSNYVCWLNEYGHQQRVNIRPVESPGLELNSPLKCCRFVVGDKEYPKAMGNTKKEAKEEAARLVYNEICGGEEKSGLGISTPVNQPQQLLNVSSIRDITKDLSAMAIDDGLAEANYVSSINEYCQKKRLSMDFILVNKQGPSHGPQFFYKLKINNQEYDVGEGKTSKEAKQKAAQLAWAVIQASASTDVGGDVPAGVSTPKSSIKDCEAGATGSPALGCNRVGSTESPALPKAQVPHVKCKNRLAAKFPNARRSSKENIYNFKDEIPGSKETISRFTSEYESIEHLGSGSFGSVYRVTDKMIKKQRAVKIIHCNNNDKALREVKALSDLSHCNIVRFYKYWFEDSGYGSHSPSDQDSQHKYLYIEMELCSSETLRSWITKTNQSQSDNRKEKSLSIFRQVVSGVEYIHSNEFIHRDLKPDNIMFSQKNEVKIGDFGLVTDVADNSQNHMERTAYKGTPNYMAPEQKQKDEYDEKVDIFALGLIYFELLWKLSDDEKREVWEDVRNRKAPAEFSQKYPFEHLMIKKMLSVNPEDRPAAKEVLRELEESNASQMKTV